MRWPEVLLIGWGEEMRPFCDTGRLAPFRFYADTSREELSLIAPRVVTSP